jgi:hypothetical protein
VVVSTAAAAVGAAAGVAVRAEPDTAVALACCVDTENMCKHCQIYISIRTAYCCLYTVQLAMILWCLCALSS